MSKSGVQAVLLRPPLRRKMRAAIQARVRKDRAQLGITPEKLTREGLPELSCDGFGGAHNLFYRKLLSTPEDGGAGWGELKGNDQFLLEVFKLVSDMNNEDERKKRGL